jgi:hypothetical protein
MAVTSKKSRAAHAQSEPLNECRITVPYRMGRQKEPASLYLADSVSSRIELRVSLSHIPAISHAVENDKAVSLVAVTSSVAGKSGQCPASSQRLEIASGPADPRPWL